MVNYYGRERERETEKCVMFGRRKWKGQMVRFANGKKRVSSFFHTFCFGCLSVFSTKRRRVVTLNPISPENIDTETVLVDELNFLA